MNIYVCGNILKGQGNKQTYQIHDDKCSEKEGKNTITRKRRGEFGVLIYYIFFILKIKYMINCMKNSKAIWQGEIKSIV